MQVWLWFSFPSQQPNTMAASKQSRAALLFTYRWRASLCVSCLVSCSLKLASLPSKCFTSSLVPCHTFSSFPHPPLYLLLSSHFLISSYLSSSHLILSCPSPLVFISASTILLYLIISYLISSYLILSYLILQYLILAYSFDLTCSFLFSSILASRILSHLIVSSLIESYAVLADLSFLILFYLIVSPHLLLPYLHVSYFTLSHLI